jgi:NAD(P)-dependent dehydrogenase (short-subunit alcohol dehydrogenase family)
VNLTGKVAIVTGSSMGIGKFVAAELLRRGATVVLNARNESRLRQTQIEFQKQGFSTLAIPADVSNPQACHDLVQQTISDFGRLDILVNNAGISMEGELEQLRPEVFQQVLAVNTLGSALVTQAALPFLRRSHGSVIFISSLAAFYGLPRFSAYCASKMALTSIAQALQQELCDSKVHVGIAYLGFTENDPDKTILSPDGQTIAQPNRNVFKAQPVGQVAAQIVQMIERRQSRRVFTTLGHFSSLVSRFAPWLARWQVQRMYHRYLDSLQPKVAGKQRNADTSNRQAQPT